MQGVRLSIYLLILIAALTLSAYLFAFVSSAQSFQSGLHPDIQRALKAKQSLGLATSRKGAYQPLSVLTQRPGRRLISR